MNVIKGRLLCIHFEPGSDLIGVSLRDEYGAEVGKWMKQPEHTFGAIQCDGKSVLSAAAFVQWLIDFSAESAIDVTMQMGADETAPDLAASAQFVRVQSEEKS